MSAPGERTEAMMRSVEEIVVGRAGEDRPFGAGLGLGLALSIPFWLGVAIALLR